MAWSPVWLQTADLEEGDLTDFNSTVDVDGIMSAHADALKNGSFGLKISPAGGTNPAYGNLTDPTDNLKVGVEFWFDINTLSMAATDTFTICQVVDADTTGVAASLLVGWTGTAYQIVQVWRSDGDPPGATAGEWISLDNDYVKLSLIWAAATGAGANNGYAHLYINDDLKESLVGLDNDTHNVDTVRAGIVAGLNATTTGSIYMDDIRWTANALIPSAQSGVLNSGGALGSWSIKKVLSGAITPSGTVSKFIWKDFKGISSAFAGITGTVTKKISKAPFTGILTSSGTITKKVIKSLAGTLSFVGTLLTKLGIIIKLILYPAPSGVVDINLTPEGEAEVDLTPEGTVELRRQ